MNRHLYAPPHAVVTDFDALYEVIENTGLATVVTRTSNGLSASHVPLLLDRTDGPHGTLLGHVARANDQWRATDVATPALAIFRGPDAYISPSWYETTRETGKVVPTWNYIAVHASGPIAFFDDRERLRGIVTRLTQRHEQGVANAWSVSDAPPEFIEQQLGGIVGFTLQIESLEGTFKLGRNRSEADRSGTIAALAESEREGDRSIAQAMRSDER